MNPATARLIRHLEHFAPLGAQEQNALASALCTVREYATREPIIREGDATDEVRVMATGLACRYRVLPDGRRQILGYIVPGDLCDLPITLLKYADHSIAALSRVGVCVVPRATVEAMLSAYPMLTRALWCSTLVEESITREWLINVGQRSAFERLAHLFCEIYERLHAVGLAHQDRCELPLTQIELGDTLALSAVHINRTLMEMRRARLISFRSRQLVIHDQAALRIAAGFDSSYLHLSNRVAEAAGLATQASDMTNASSARNASL